VNHLMPVPALFFGDMVLWLFLADHGLRRLVLPRRPGGGMFAALMHSVTGGGQR
jgi:hypothetical protein